MTGLDDAGREELRRLAEGARGCGLVRSCSDPNHAWYYADELLHRLDGSVRVQEEAAFVATTTPDVVLGLLDEVASLEVRMAHANSRRDIAYQQVARLRRVIHEAVDAYDRDRPDYEPAFIADLQLELGADRD